MKAYVTRNAEGWMRVFPKNWEVAFDARNGKTLIVKVYDVERFLSTWEDK